MPFTAVEIISSRVRSGRQETPNQEISPKEKLRVKSSETTFGQERTLVGIKNSARWRGELTHLPRNELLQSTPSRVANSQQAECHQGESGGLP